MPDILRRARERLTRDDRGASLVEYALLVVLVAMVCFGAIAYLGTSGGDSLDRSGTCFDSAFKGDDLPAECE